MSNDLSSRIEALLFTEGGSLTLRKLASLLGLKEPALDEGLDELQKQLESRGLALVRSDTEATLAVAPKVSEEVRAAYGRELEKDIGEAGLEVLSIILYRGPSTRAQIDYIRGVNTSWTIRNLLTRGLLERAGNPEDGREYLYRPTVELLVHLGVQKGSELPEQAKIHEELAAFESNMHKEEQTYGETD